MQVDALIKAGCHPDDIKTEKVSGAKRRPMLELLLMQIQPGDTFMVWKLDRLGRSLGDLIRKVEWFRERNIKFRSLTEGIDTTTPVGTLLLHILGAAAQFERDLTIERTKAGMAARKARGLSIGPKLIMTEEKIEEAAEMFARKLGIGEVRRHFGVSANTIYRYIPPHEIRKLQKFKL